jgi:arginine utilization regulatory protein
MPKENNLMEQLKFENKLLKTVFDSVHESISVTNKDGIITFYNSEAENCEGLSKEDVLGQNEQTIYPGPFQNRYFDNTTKTVLETGRPLLEQQLTYILPSGRECSILIDAYPFFYQGKLEATYAIGRNLRQVNNFINRAIELHRNYSGEAYGAYQDGTHYTLDDIVGSSEQIKKVISLARKIAVRNSPVLIYGRTGTGKELFAQGIHRASLVKGPFIAINCAAIPETLLESLIFGTTKGAFTDATEAPGLFEQAENGTLFLDEINSMPISLQAKLLRVLQDKMVRRVGGKQERPVNCRIISATNVDPANAIKEKQIREDLYYRLAAVTFEVPPLKDRWEDIGVLIKYFIDKYNREYGLYVKRISPELLTVFEKYDWPGNVRELENIIEGAMNFVEVGEETLTRSHIPTNFFRKLTESSHSTIIKNSGTLHEILTDVEKKVIETALQKNNWKIGKTAQELGIFRQALHYRINKLGISIPDVSTTDVE